MVVGRSVRGAYEEMEDSINYDQTVICGIGIMNFINNPERNIRSFVKANEAELVEIAEQYLDYEQGLDKYYKKVEIDGVFEGEYPIVQFYYSGFGIAPLGTYYGFYYSPDDAVTTYCNEDYPVKMCADGEWEWSGVGDNSGVTKKIQDNWYYYEAWF